MKKIVLAICLSAITTICFADSYLIIANMGSIKKGGDYLTALSASANNGGISISDESFKADRGSVFKLINGTNTLIGNDGIEYVAVIFTKTGTTGTGYVAKDSIYLIPNDKISSSYYVQLYHGFDYGALTIPFKLRFNPTIISPTASLGFYAGYKIRIGYDWTSSFIGTVGLSGISLNDVNSKDPQNVLGLTYAIGTIFSFRSKFQLGFVVGADLIGGDNGNNWTYENKPWLAIATGFTFLK